MKGHMSKKPSTKFQFLTMCHYLITILVSSMPFIIIPNILCSSIE